MPDKKTCFIIAPIGDPDTPTRKRSDQAELVKSFETPAGIVY